MAAASCPPWHDPRTRTRCARATRSRLPGQMAALGVTTVECKSGYGLERDTELHQLGVYRRLGEEGPQRIVPTLLAAHVVPPEYRERRHEYVSLIVDAMIPEAARDGLARFCDVFVEEGAFSVDEARRILRRRHRRTAPAQAARRPAERRRRCRAGG